MCHGPADVGRCWRFFQNSWASRCWFRHVFPELYLEQCLPDIWTQPDTSRECGTSSPRRNLWSNVVQMSAHSQTPPGSVGPVPLKGISRAMLSGHLHTPRHVTFAPKTLTHRL